MSQRRSPAPEYEDDVADGIYGAVAAVAALPVVVAGGSRVVDGLVLLALVPWALLLTRRELPLPAFAALGVVPVFAIVAITGTNSTVFMSTAVASRVACRATSRWLPAVTTAVVVVLPFAPELRGLPFDVGSPYFAFGNLFGVGVGLLVRRTRVLAARIRAADARLAAAAVREERARLARDVHDLVAHSLTVVVLHVGGARRSLRTDAAVAEQALVEAERVCRESLDGVRGVVGLLRDTDEAPEPTLDLERLADSYRSAGRKVDLHTSGDSAALPLLTRVTVFRVVQEALANAARYARDGRTIVVDVRVDEEGVRATVTNEVTGTASPAGRLGGFGLIGLREQVAAVGGTARSGRDGTTWVVDTWLPSTPAARSVPAGAE